MSYLSQPTSNVDYGVVKVGNHISVTEDGVIFLDQDLSQYANVVFNKLDVAGDVTSNGDFVITDIMPYAGEGIFINSIESGGPHASFTVYNTGVLSLQAGPGISISNSTGHITLSATGADVINVHGTTTSYTVTDKDEYIGVYSPNNTTITLPEGVDGRMYYIKDEYGQGSGKITIEPQTGQYIDGKTRYVISTPNQCVTIVFRSWQWRII